MSNLPDIEELDFDKPLPPVRRKLRTRGASLLGLSALLVATGGLGAWASRVPLDSAIVVPGTVTLAGKRKEVQHLDGGIVRAFTVRDGDHVNEGDVLIEFDTFRPAARLSVVQVGYFSALGTDARLAAERDGRTEILFPPEFLDQARLDPEVQAILTSQEQLFAARRDELDGQVKLLESKIEQLQEEIRGYEVEQNAGRQQLEIVQEEHETLKQLLAKGYTTRTRILSIQRELFQLEGTIGRLDSQIANTTKQIGEAQLSLVQIQKTNQTEVMSEYRENQARLLDLQEQYLTGQGELERTVVRAPSSGIIMKSKVHTLGGVVASGETLLEIIPDDDQLVIEVRLRPQDVDDVHVGQPTEVRLSAFNQRSTPSLEGKLIFVSADTLSEPPSPEPFYVAKIAVKAEELRRLGDVRLQPGMPAEAMIKTGERTAMAYLMQPLTDSMSRAWREQ